MIIILQILIRIIAVLTKFKIHIEHLDSLIRKECTKTDNTRTKTCDKQKSISRPSTAASRNEPRSDLRILYMNLLIYNLLWIYHQRNEK